MVLIINFCRLKKNGIILVHNQLIHIIPVYQIKICVFADHYPWYYIHVANKNCLMEIFQVDDSSRQLCKTTELVNPGTECT